MLKAIKEINRCPHCSEYGIDFIQKFFLGSETSVKCRYCKKDVSVPYKESVFVYIISLLIWLLAIQIFSPDLKTVIAIIVYILAYIILGGTLNWYFLPLVPKFDYNPVYNLNDFLNNLGKK